MKLPTIDLGASLTSGQVFRFRLVGSVWEGVDGPNVYGLTEPLEPAVSPELHRFLRLDWDYEVVLPELVRRGPELEPLLPGLAGVRLLRPSCPRETLFCFLCTANNHLSRIATMIETFADYGSPMLGGSLRWPTLDVIASIPESELRQRGFGYRAKTIPEVARTLVSRGGDAWFEDMHQASYSDLVTELLTLPGVGPKLADCIALYGFDRTEAVPVDTHLWQAAVRVYHPEFRGTALTLPRARTVASHMRDRFGELAALAQQVLFYTNLRAMWARKSTNDLEF